MELALLSAYKKNFDSKTNAKVTINRETGDIKIYSYITVVEEVEDPETQISLEDALKRDKTKEGTILSDLYTGVLKNVDIGLSKQKQARIVGCRRG